MKLKIRQNILMEQLNYAIRGISSKNLIPILNCIKFELTNDGLYLMSTDNEISIKTFITSKDIEEIINSLKDIETEIQVAAERGFLDGINGSCHIPIGAYCDVDGENISLTGLYGDEDGNNLITKTINGKASEAREIGLQLAKLISKEYECYEG